MQASGIANNIIKCVKSSCSDNKAAINILYDKAFSLFDHVCYEIDGINIFQASEMVKENTNFISYDLFLSNNPIWCSSNLSSISTFHINTIVYFHNVCPNNFKKEDKFLLKNSIKSAYKIFSTELVMRSWGLDLDDPRSSILNYGVATPTETTNKDIQVCILNINQNPSIDNIYTYIKNIYPNSVLINNKHTRNEISETLSRSIVCIESDSVFNILTAISNKCSVISATKQIYVNGLTNIDSYENIHYNIKQAIDNYSAENASKYSDDIVSNYQYAKFCDALIKTLRQIIREPYIYAKNI